jgi:hypothetical protein
VSGPAHDFDIVSAAPLPLQSAIRPDTAPESLDGYVRFLEELEEIFGQLTPSQPSLTGDCFRL